MQFTEKGFEIVDNFIDPRFLEKIKSEVTCFDLESKRGGVRSVEKKFGTVRELLEQGSISKIANIYLKEESKFVRAILFDKTPTNNWMVTWHQDKTIAVSSKQEIEGWGPWSIKDNCHHVQPSIDVLNRMVTFRIHLDESTAENGCLKVIPGSHQYGVIPQEKIHQYWDEEKVHQCIAKQGSAIVMKPLILHASSKAVKPCNRRVLHL